MPYGQPLKRIFTLIFAGLSACFCSLVATPPRLVSVNPIAPEVLALYIQEGEVTRSQLLPYTAQHGDEIVELTHDYIVAKNADFITTRELYRDGELIGYMSGNEQQVYVTLDHYRGDPLILEITDSPKSYSLQSDTDPNYRVARSPVKIDRKSKPNQFGRSQQALGLIHTVYLHLPDPLQEGHTYSLDLALLGLDRASILYSFDPQTQRSEAIHVNQVGFDPKDPVKRAYVSLWMGESGGYDFGEALTYHVIDTISGKRMFSGTAPIHWEADTPDLMYRTDNYTEADVYRLDFPEVTQPGQYYVQVEGVGRSYPFEIKSGVWKDMARLALRGIYHHRSGIALEEPYTDWLRPRPHHPDDGVRVYQSQATLLETTMGMMGGTRSSFTALTEDVTDETLPYAWGGMMDAGDWDRRAQHMIVTRWLMEFYQMQPTYAFEIDMNIPESGNDLPDLVDEALWVLDFFVRMQREDGAGSGGVESAEHPAPGDVSWNEILPVYAYGYDFWSTHTLVATAAQAALALQDLRPDLTTRYTVAALKGLRWAEKEYARMQAEGMSYPDYPDAVAMRQLAALNLYALTGDEQWHELFLEASKVPFDRGTLAHWHEAEIEFAYARLAEGLGNPSRKQEAREWVIASGDSTLTYVENNAYSIAGQNRTTQIFFGMLSAPVEAIHLVRAHHLTGDSKYLEPMFAASQFGLGANPDNFCYIVGAGSNPVQWVLHEDSMKTNRQAPPGTIVCGPFDHRADYVPDIPYLMMWSGFFNIDEKMDPDMLEWPVFESYIDMWNYGSQNEYTPWQTMARPIVVWAYMAAMLEQK